MLHDCTVRVGMVYGGGGGGGGGGVESCMTGHKRFYPVVPDPQFSIKACVIFGL